ncbi:MAG TPA: hypothetical protein DC054_02755 [Blastocatellia bacterium]|nr:hypothetical protein [Blastocatellia bacterium]
MGVALVFVAGAGAAMRAFFQDADISVSKTGPDTAPADTDITYTITVSTSGTEDISGASLSDKLPTGTTFVSKTKPASWSCTDPNSGNNFTLTCTNSLVPAGSNDVFTLTVHVNSGTAPGTFITNVAKVSGANDVDDENNQSTAVTQVPGNSADLSLTKSSPSQVHANTDVTFTISVTNLGPNTATNVSFTDSLPGGSPSGFPMTFVSFIQGSGPVWNCGSPGSTTTCSIASLPASTTSVFSFVGHIPAGSSSTYINETTVNSYTDSSHMVISNADPNPENDTGSTTVTASSCFIDQTVTTNADNGAGSLRQAILDACDGSTIGFDMSQVVSPITLTTAGLVIDKNLTIQGPGANLLTIQRSAAGGTPSFRVFAVNAFKSLTIAGATVSNGSAVGASPPANTGGNFFNSQGTLTINNCVVKNAAAGGGIGNISGTVVIDTTLVSGNSGPGIRNQVPQNVASVPATVTINNSTFSGNTDAAIDNNVSIGKSSSPANVIVNNSTITGNNINSTGSAAISNGVGSGGIATITLTNSTISGNANSTGVGGIGNAGVFAGASNATSAVVTLTNTTVFGNVGAGSGGTGGIANVVSSCSGCEVTVRLRNTIVAGNTISPGGTASDISGTVDANSSSNLIGTGGAGGLTNGVNNNQVGVASPRLGPLANNGGPTLTHALLSGSPALDAGDNCVTQAAHCSDPNIAQLTTDQRAAGFARAVDGPDVDTTDTVDIGAFEAQVSVQDIPDSSANEDTQFQLIFNVGGAASITSVTASSSNTALVPNNPANIAVSGSSSTRTLTINPVANQFGTSTITITVNGINSQSMTDTFVLTVAPVADTPSVTNATANEDTQNTTGLVVSRNAVDSTEVTHFKISGITNGTLFKNDGLSQINNGDFITFAEGNAGLKFLPAANLFSPGTTFSFQVQAATSNDGSGVSSGFATATITVNPVADTPSVTNASTTVNTQTTNGLVISRNAADGTEVTNFKITNITNGTLFKNNGTTQINNNDFITFAEGNAGLKFTPALDSNANGSFQVQASTSNANGGLGGGLATATITVNCGPTLVLNSNDSGSGSLRATINTACAGSTLTFAPNLTGQTITLTSGELPISKSLTIQGPAANLTVMRSTAGGTPQFRVFNVTATNPAVVTIFGLTISNGSGGTNGGGILNSNTATLNVTTDVLSNNTAQFGGGLLNLGNGPVNITTSTFNNNTATNSGGGIYNNGTSAVNIVNSTVSGNTAAAGGGIFNVQGGLNLNNSTISNNSAPGGAGAGGGIFNNNIAPAANLVNTIVAGNTAGTANGPDVQGTFNSQGNNLIGAKDGSNGLTNGVKSDIVGTIATPVNALLAPLGNYGGPTQTMALLPGSPALNAGSNNLAAGLTDQRGSGFDRIVNGTVDIGAFESRGFTITATSGTPQNATILTAFGSPLVANVAASGGEPFVGGVIRFTAPASGASATLTGGAITANATINGSGQASTSATANGLAGAYNVTASGASSTSASFSLTNNRAATSTAVTSSVNPSDLNQSVTFTATVTGPVAKSGTVQFKDNGANLGGPAAVSSSGVAQLSTTALSTGTHTITADYSGDANLLPSTGTLAGGQTVIFRPLIKFSQSNYNVNENGSFVTITVNRSGDQSTAFSIDYTTPDDSAAMSVLPCSNANGVASPRCDFTTALGTLRFAAGESSKTFDVLISQDTFVEGNETIALTLSNPTGGGGFAQPSDANATVTIIDDDLSASSVNPNDDTDTFVRQTYHDFLNREPDAQGLAFWKDNIDKCNDPARRPAGLTAAQCLDVQRINTSAAFFLSIEFQNTGYFVERTYKSGFGDINPPTVPVPIRFTNFLRDTQGIGAGVVVGVGNWQAQLDANKRAYALAFVQRPEFLSRYPALTSAAAFVDALNANAGMVLTDNQRSALVAELAPNSADPALRADVLMKVAENAVLQQREFNRAFVLMQYFGYLRRNPDAAPEATLNFAGFNFWLNKLNQFNGDYIGAEMIKAFIGSAEYRKRFGP